MTYSYELSTTLDASAERVYSAWLSSEEHSAMTGGTAEIDPQVGGEFSCWDGYISGTTLELEPKVRIVQSWRTAEFADDQPDSRIEVSFLEAGPGCRVVLVHSLVPDDQRAYEESGWESFYFAPMREYFAPR
jgi:uncharacterized protein YndB with AHSA1/START domain